MAAIVVFVVAMMQFRIFTLNQWQQHSLINTLRSPNAQDCVVVFAPHCDDETLGCGGLLALAKQNGARLKVVLLTNGDGFKFAAARTYKTVRLTHGRMVNLAYKRQKETLAALNKLGLTQDDVVFLGYPDRGLSKLWEVNWSPKTPYTSPFTGWNYVGYKNAPSRYAPYCGHSLSNDIKKVLIAQKPTQIFIPHPMDNHPDHYVTYCFVTNVLEQLELEGETFAGKAKVYTYLVHRGEWPPAVKSDISQNLTPPYSLVQGDTTWKSLRLPDQVARHKRLAIMCYKTQTNIEKNFLLGFARSNELFGVLHPKVVARMPQGYMSGVIDIHRWQGIVPVINDAISDNVMAEMSESGDVRSVYACQDGRLLFLRVDFNGKLSKRLSYNISIKNGDLTDRMPAYRIQIDDLSRVTPEDLIWSYKDDSLQIVVPLKVLGDCDSFYVRTAAYLSKMKVDNTGWRMVMLRNQQYEQAREQL